MHSLSPRALISRLPDPVIPETMCALNTSYYSVNMHARVSVLIDMKEGVEQPLQASGKYQNCRCFKNYSLPSKWGHLGGEAWRLP